MSRKASEASTKRLGTASAKAIDPVLTSLLAAIDQLAEKVEKLTEQK